MKEIYMRLKAKVRKNYELCLQIADFVKYSEGDDKRFNMSLVFEYIKGIRILACEKHVENGTDQDFESLLEFERVVLEKYIKDITC